MPEHTFICMTDMKIERESLPLVHGWPGWWSKLELFSPSLPDAPTLFLDLDTVLVGDCADVVRAVAEGDTKFAILRDVYRGRANPMAMQSSVMFWSGRDSIAGVYEKFTADPAAAMKRFRGDQDFLESAVSGAMYLQDLTLGFCSFKRDVQRRGLLPKDRVVFFHGRPRPWDQDIIPYPLRKSDHRKAGALALRRGWVVPADDARCLPSVIGAIGDLEAMIAMCPVRRTAIQAGGNFGIWPARLARDFQRCITFEPDSANFRALEINTCDAANIQAHNKAVGREPGRGSLRRESGNAGAHWMNGIGDEFDIVTIDSIGVRDCDFIQLDLEGGEYDALIGARETILLTHPLISVELKGLGGRFGHTDQDCVDLLASWGYEHVARRSRDSVFRFKAARRAVQLENMPIDPPVKTDESCVLVGNGPSALLGDGAKIDSFDHVVRFNNFKLRGFEEKVGSKTTLWATFGRGMTPADPDVRPDRIVFIHDHNSDPAYVARELWRIPHSFFRATLDKFAGAVGNRGGLLPSSGFLVASWLLSLGVKKIHLSGFDHFSKEKSGLHHYWVNRSFKRPAEHDGDHECRLFAEWVTEGRVEYLLPSDGKASA